jgi:hypothetical protein
MSMELEKEGMETMLEVEAVEDTTVAVVEVATMAAVAEALITPAD